MAKKRGVRIALIVEDEALERFSREVLRELGFHRREVRVTPYPVGQGSAKDWVNERYPTEVRVLRGKAYQNLGIVVGTDADEMTVHRRAEQLADALRRAAAAPRGPEERVVLWIPKWNVETWLLYFAGDARDEDHNHKNALKKPDYRRAAQAFAAEYHNYKGGGSPVTQPSLELAYEETKRLGI